VRRRGRRRGSMIPVRLQPHFSPPDCRSAPWPRHWFVTPACRTHWIGQARDAETTLKFQILCQDRSSTRPRQRGTDHVRIRAREFYTLPKPEVDAIT
jgi:hypothetical protein